MFRIFSLLQVALQSLFQQKLRSFLSILGMVCGVLAVMTMLATGEGAQKKVLSELESLGLRNIYIEQVQLGKKQRDSVSENQSRGLTWNDIERIEKHDHYVEAVTAVLKIEEIPLDLKRETVPEVAYVTSEFNRLSGLQIQKGRFFTYEDFSRNNLVCVLGADIARSFRPAAEVGSFIRINDKLFKVVGILHDAKTQSREGKEISRENPDDMIFLSFTHKMASGQISSHDLRVDRIIVKIRPNIDVLSAAESIQRILQLNHQHITDYNLIVPLELLQKKMRTQAIFNLVLTVVAGISLLVGGIGIMNIMLANISERKREIGIRRAVGATHHDIILQFLLETVCLTTVGGLIGLLSGLASTLLIEKVAGWPVQITPLSIILPFGLAVTCGIIFGLHPAVKASRLEPLQALRSA